VGSEAVKPGKKGLEAAARDARYRFFATLDGKIATAHTADDNAETVLMHMVRGTGLKGLGAISPVRENLIRPMLTVTREQVLEFLAEYHQGFVEDSSNDTDEFLRNRLRHHVMPLLKQENPKLSENLSAMAMRLRQDEEALSQIPDLSRGLDIYQVRDLHPSQRSRVLDAFLKHSGVKEPEAAHIAQAEALLFAQSPSARASFPGGVTVGRVYDRLTVAKEDAPLEKIFLECPGMLEIPQLGMKVYCTPASQIANTANIFTVQPTGKLVVRSRETGDEIRLSVGTKSLKKLFIDKKIPAEERNRIPVLADDEGILGVYGIGVHTARQAKELPAVQIRFEVIEAIEKINA
jgi:tRNA(Ile)-lysidine synthase